MNISKFYFYMLICLLFYSCASTQTAWKINGLEARKESLANKKDALLFFTGSDWDEKSKGVFDKINFPQLFTTAGKSFLLFNVDVVKNEELLPAKVLKENYMLFSTYNVDNLPFIVLQTSDGDVYVAETLKDEINSVDDFNKFLEKTIPKKQKITELRRKIRTTEGHEKTKYIDEFFQVIYNPQDAAYSDLRRKAVESDPENKSGLKGKFIFFIARLAADKLGISKKYTEAGNEFLKAIKTGFLSADDEQAAWFNAAYLHGMSGIVKNDELIIYLENGIRANPKSNAVPQLKAIIKNLQEKKTN